MQCASVNGAKVGSKKEMKKTIATFLNGIHHKFNENKNALTETTIFSQGVGVSTFNKQLFTCKVMFKIMLLTSQEYGVIKTVPELFGFRR